MEFRANYPRALALLHFRPKPEVLYPTLVRGTLREKSIYLCQVWDSEPVGKAFWQECLGTALASARCKGEEIWERESRSGCGHG